MDEYNSTVQYFLFILCVFAVCLANYGEPPPRGPQNEAIFGDGSTFECDVIVACTGYKNTFPFAEETHPDINEYGQNPRLLYKQVCGGAASVTRVHNAIECVFWESLSIHRADCCRRRGGKEISNDRWAVDVPQNVGSC